MLKVRLIPCMLFNGLSVVKTTQFSTMRTLGNPIQFARVYNHRNVDELIFIDLKASEEGREPLYDVIHDMTIECFMPLTIGGGIHSIETISKLLGVGADKVSINSEALQNPEFITQAAERFGSQCLVVSIDAKLEGDDHYVFSNRGTVNTGKKVTAWANEVEKRGAGEIFLNSIDTDGVMQGYDLDLIKKVIGAVTIPVIVCGGAGTPDHVVDAVTKAGANAVSVASMFHYSEQTSESIKLRMREAGIPVRIIRTP